MEENKRLLIRVFLLGILISSLFYITETLNTKKHEEVHKAIYTYYGYPAHIEYSNLGLSGKTICETNVTESDFKAMYPLHIENEIITYNLDSLKLILYAICFILAIIMAEIIHIGKSKNINSY